MEIRKMQIKASQVAQQYRICPQCKIQKRYGSIPESERFPGEGNGNPFQYSCLENPLGRGTLQVTVHGVTRARHDLATT